MPPSRKTHRKQQTPHAIVPLAELSAKRRLSPPPIGHVEACTALLLLRNQASSTQQAPPPQSNNEREESAQNAILSVLVYLRTRAPGATVHSRDVREAFEHLFGPKPIPRRQ